MIRKIQRIFKLSILFIIAFGLLNLISPQEASSKSKKSKCSKVSHKKSRKSRRSYNPDLTRAQAIDAISASEEISNLAGIETESKNAPVIENKTGEAYFEPGEDLLELEREDDVVVEMDTFKSLWITSVDDIGDEDETLSSGIAKKDIMGVIMTWLGTPYHFGGLTDRGIDCSAFVQRVYRNAGEIHLPRTAQEQFGVGRTIRRNDLQFGDMVFFHTRRHAYASHVGIYLGDNLFAHASSRFGVTVSSLESTYYDKRFIGARRLSVSDVSKLSLNK